MWDQHFLKIALMERRAAVKNENIFTIMCNCCSKRRNLKELFILIIGYKVFKDFEIYFPI